MNQNSSHSSVLVARISASFLSGDGSGGATRFGAAGTGAVLAAAVLAGMAGFAGAGAGAAGFIRVADAALLPSTLKTLTT